MKVNIRFDCLSDATVTEFADLYLKETPSPRPPTGNIPPVFVIGGQREIFIEDIVAWACLTEEEGVHVQMLVESAQVHDFAISPRMCVNGSQPEHLIWEKSVGAVATWIEKITAGRIANKVKKKKSVSANC